MFRQAAAEVNRCWHLPKGTQSDAAVKWDYDTRWHTLKRRCEAR
jgi:hypothetical protein